MIKISVEFGGRTYTFTQHAADDAVGPMTSLDSANPPEDINSKVIARALRAAADVAESWTLP